MSIIRWDPWRDLMAMQNELNRLFERTFNAEEHTARRKAWAPAIDMYEQGGSIVVRAELPGIKADDVDISVIDNSLVIKGERKFKEETSEENYYRIEQRYGAFERVIPLPLKIDTENVTATFNEGMLEVTLPKAEDVKPKQIAIKVNKDNED